MESKIKVGSFIQLPTVNNLKPTKKKKIDKSSLQHHQPTPSKVNRSIDRLSSQAQQSSLSRSLNQSAAKTTGSSSSKSSSNQQTTTKYHDPSLLTTKLSDEDKQKKLDDFVDLWRSIFNKKLIELKYKKQIINEQIEKEICSVTPPFEWFIQDQIDADLRRSKFFSYLEEDDYLVGALLRSVSKTKSDTKKACFKLLSFDGCKRRMIHDLNLTAFYLVDDDDHNPIVKELTNVENESRYYFRFKVHKVIKEQIYVTFNHSSAVHENLYLNLGPIDYDELPEHFKKVIQLKQQEMNSSRDHNQPNTSGSIYSFDRLMHSNKQFLNPTSVDYLLETLQIDNEENFFKNKQLTINDERHLNEDLKSGINCLKKEEYEKAEQFLDKVLKVEPRNADAYVAKGCVLANQSKYVESLKEFENALALDENSVNAKKYLIEVSHTIGKDMCKEKAYDVARDVFERVLTYDPNNEEAKRSIQLIDDKLSSKEESERKKNKKSSKRSPSYDHESSSKKKNY